MEVDELLAVYDREVRGSFPARLPSGWTGEQDGPLTRCRAPHLGFAMFTGDADALTSEELSALVDRTVGFFARSGQRFEWKTFDHDRADLLPLLQARGAEPGPREALVMGETAVLADVPVLPDGLSLREVTAREDLERVAAMESEVWGEDWSWLVDDLADRLSSDEPIRVFVVEEGDRVVSAAWLAPMSPRIAGLWGGSTLAAYRGRGIYRALVAQRARLALSLGHPFVQVDASDDSRPILERLGLRVVGGTVPYMVAAPGAS